MRAFGIVVSVFLGLALLIGAAAPQEASADWCFNWFGAIGIGLVCPHLAATHPGNPGGALFSLPASGAHAGGGNCTTGAVGTNHSLQMSFVANVTGGGIATGRINLGWLDNAAGPGCTPTMNQINLTGFFGAGPGYAFNLGTGATTAENLTFAFINGSEEDLEEAVKNLPPLSGEGPHP